MWTNRNLDDLETFSEWIDENGSEQLYDGLKMETDEVTQDALLEWFFYRRVVDNEKFKRFFRRMLNTYENQYYDYVRIETTEIDPVVGNYLERQVLRKGNRSENGNESETETGTNSGRSVSTDRNGGTSTTTTEGTATGQGSSTASTTENGTTSGTSNTDAKSKHGETPQAAVGSGDSMALDWTYLSSQDETQTGNTTSGTTTGTTSTTGSTNDSSRTTGTATTTTSGTANGEVTNSGNSNKTRTGTNSRNENTADDTRERLTGRQEAAQDMLARARDYITQTNAFLWLVDKMDVCFMQILEV